MTERCTECGMKLVDPVEFHPIEACRLFRASRSRREVRQVMRRDPRWPEHQRWMSTVLAKRRERLARLSGARKAGSHDQQDGK